MYGRVAVLPVGESMNPLNPAGATYFDKDQVAYVLFKTSDKRTRPTRVVTSFGLVPGWKIGTELVLEHDQTQYYMGDYQIVGIHDFASGEWAGDVPNYKIKHAVLK